MHKKKIRCSLRIKKIYNKNNKKRQINKKWCVHYKAKIKNKKRRIIKKYVYNKAK